jgi:hypothetical protein
MAPHPVNQGLTNEALVHPQPPQLRPSAERAFKRTYAHPKPTVRAHTVGSFKLDRVRIVRRRSCSSRFTASGLPKRCRYSKRFDTIVYRVRSVALTRGRHPADSAKGCRLAAETGRRDWLQTSGPSLWVGLFDEEACNWHYRVPALQINAGDLHREDRDQQGLLPGPPPTSPNRFPPWAGCSHGLHRACSPKWLI